MVYALDDLPECALVYNFDNLIPISQLLSDLCNIVPFFISNLILVLPSDRTYGVDFFKYSELNFLKLRQLGAESIQRFLRTKSVEICSYDGTLAAGGLRFCGLAASLTHLINADRWGSEETSEKGKNSWLFLVVLRLWLKVRTFLKVNRFRLLHGWCLVNTLALLRLIKLC